MNLPEPPELLPCPFCGTKPEPPEKEYAPHWKDEYWKVSCTRCDFDLYHNGPHNVAQAWNNRPADLEIIRAFSDRVRQRREEYGEHIGGEEYWKDALFDVLLALEKEGLKDAGSNMGRNRQL